MVDNQAIALVLQEDKLAYCCWDQKAAGNEVFLNLGQDLCFGLVVRSPFVGGRRTGVRMDGLVSYQDQQTAPL